MKIVKHFFFVQLQYTCAIWQSNGYSYMISTRMQLLIQQPKSMHLLMFMFMLGADPSENVPCSAPSFHHKGEIGLSSIAT